MMWKAYESWKIIDFCDKGSKLWSLKIENERIKSLLIITRIYMWFHFLLLYKLVKLTGILGAKIETFKEFYGS